MGITEASGLEEGAQVRRDHTLHWLAVFAVAGYAWQLHGFFVAIAMLLGLLAVIGVTNIALIATTGSIRSTRWSRWGWVSLAAFAVVASGAELASV